MKLLEGKTALVFGVANEKSIAWGITSAFHQQGARIGLSYAGEVLERRVRPLAESIGCTFVEPCDVTQDGEIDRIVGQAEAAFGHIDILIHSIAFAGRDALSGPYYNISREEFLRAMDISVYSLTALSRAFQPLFNPGGSILTLTYYAAEKVFPNYNVMAIAKAALEASVRYLANDLGTQDVRVNAISAGPIRTLSAAGVSGFRTMYKKFTDYAPLHKTITTEDIGNAALFLCSDMSSKITGEILFVDSGYNILGAPSDVEV
jgi:enoyl-[acyl-carrier protein] reductase I